MLLRTATAIARCWLAFIWRTCCATRAFTAGAKALCWRLRACHARIDNTARCYFASRSPHFHSSAAYRTWRLNDAIAYRERALVAATVNAAPSATHYVLTAPLPFLHHHKRASSRGGSALGAADVARR